MLKRSDKNELLKSEEESSYTSPESQNNRSKKRRILTLEEPELVIKSEEGSPEVSDEEPLFISYLKEEEDSLESEEDCTLYSAPGSNSESSCSVNANAFVQWLELKPNVEPIPFTGSPGLRAKPSGDRPIDYFRMLATSDFLEMVVARTNANGQRLMKTATAKHARIKVWKNLTIDTFLKFMGVIFLMGQIQLPSFSHYWKQKFPYSNPVFPSVISRDKFLLILRCLCFAEYTENSLADPLYEIQPLLNLFQAIMDKVYYPDKELCILESKIWNGNLHGSRLCMLAQSDGLVLNALVSAGGPRHATKAVKNLVQQKLGVGHALYADDFYTSVSLAQDLISEKTYLTGKLRKFKKNNPPEVVKISLKKGDIIERFTENGISVFKWEHKGELIMISSEFDGQFKAYKKGGKLTRAPESVINYNKFMPDMCGQQLLGQYPFEKKIMRWSTKLGLQVFHLMLNNSYLLFRRCMDSDAQLLSFRDAVIVDLLGGVPQNPVRQLFVGVHLPIITHTALRKRCRECFKRGIRSKKSRFLCPYCPGQPGLCLTPCFRDFHNYSI